MAWPATAPASAPAKSTVATVLAVDELSAGCRRYGAARGSRRPWSIRRLLPSDLPAIRAINAATYGGHDYVAACFQGWLEREGRSLWTAAAEDGEGSLAGLEVLSLYDGGRTGWLEALRVQPCCRGRGVATALQSHLVALARDTLGLSRVRFTTATGNVPSRKLAARCGLDVVASWGVLAPRRRMALADLAARLRAVQARLRRKYAGAAAWQCGVPTAGLVGASVPRATAALLAAHGTEAKLPFLLQYNWKAFDFTLQNLEALLQAGQHEEPLFLPPLGDDGCASNSGIGSFSWAFRQRDALGLTVFVTVYASGLPEALAHMAAQAEAAIEARADHLMLMYEPSLEPTLHLHGLVERSSTPLDGNPAVPAPKCMLLFERRFGG